jgi:hypothetical protein
MLLFVFCCIMDGSAGVPLFEFCASESRSAPTMASEQTSAKATARSL